MFKKYVFRVWILLHNLGLSNIKQDETDIRFDPIENTKSYLALLYVDFMFYNTQKIIALCAILLPVT